MSITTCISAAVIEQLVCCQLDLLILCFFGGLLRRGGSGRVLFIWVSCTSHWPWSKHCYSDRCLLLRSLCFTPLGFLLSRKTKFPCKQWSQHSLALSIAGNFVRELCTFPLQIRFFFLNLFFGSFTWVDLFIFLLFVCCLFACFSSKKKEQGLSFPCCVKQILPYSLSSVLDVPITRRLPWEGCLPLLCSKVMANGGWGGSMF